MDVILSEANAQAIFESSSHFDFLDTFDIIIIP